MNESTHFLAEPTHFLAEVDLMIGAPPTLSTVKFPVISTTSDTVDGSVTLCNLVQNEVAVRIKEPVVGVRISDASEASLTRAFQCSAKDFVDLRGSTVCNTVDPRKDTLAKILL